MRMSRIIVSILALIILSTPALAEEKVRVVTEDFAPFNFLENGKTVGISTAIVKAAFERAGVDYAIEVLPWDRAVMETNDTPNTFIYTMALTEKRKNKYIWVGKLFDRKVALVRHKDRGDLDALTQEDLRYNTKLCAIEGDASYELLRQLGFPEGNFITVAGTSYNLCAKMVQEKRVDLTAYNPYALAYEVEKGDLEDAFKIHSMIANEDGYYLAAHPDSDPKLIEKLQQAFKELADEGFNDKIAAEYIGY